MRVIAILLFLSIKSFGQSTVWDEVDSLLMAEGYDITDTAIDYDKRVYAEIPPIDQSKLTAEEKSALHYINLVRTNPKEFLRILKAYPAKHTSFYKSLVKTLDTISPMRPLKNFDVLNGTAKHHSEDMGKYGYTGHKFHDGSDVQSVCGNIYECCDYGNVKGLDIVMSLLIDDGVASLGHRNTILESRIKEIGISTSSHKVYSYGTCVHFQ